MKFASLPLVLVTIPILVSLCCTTSAATDTISVTTPLLANQTIISKGGKFELGFFRPNGSNKFYIAIWYHNLPVQTVVWIGNRKSPLNDTSSAKLVTSPENANLELLQASSVIWSSNLSSSSSSSNTAVLLDSGNFVLLASTDNGVIWQSFDHPSETLIPGAWLGQNKITGEYQSLTSWKSADDPAPGMFYDTVDPGGSSEFFYLWNRSKIYWRTGVWTGKVFALIPEMRMNTLFNMTYVETPQYRRVTSVLYDNSTITRMVMDLTGQTKQYLWDNSSQSWSLFWSMPSVQCDAYALCGRFGVCDVKNLPFCQCPQGFEPSSEEEWQLSDWSGGCRRKTQLQCGLNGSQADGFLEMSNLQLPDNAVGARNVETRIECESTCLVNCSCMAYAYSNGSGCLTWTGELLNIEQLDISTGGSNTTLYLRLAASELQNFETRKKVNTALIISVCIISVLVCGVVGLVWFVIHRRKSATKLDGKESMILFRYADLRRATKNFSDRLGSGGFGSVYRGVLKDGVVVAVKKLEGLRQGEKQFRTEVSTLGLIHHVNLVRLLGFCCEGDNKLLVYEFMTNGSLNSYLSSNSNSSLQPLSWRARYQIMLGVARGLTYLHEGCRECIIHCDIKPENILLDSDFHPKIADFGMAKLVGRDFSRVLTTMRGTIGYLAPEWISGVPINAKADVYSFGMVLFELIAGRRNSEHVNVSTEPGFLAAWAAIRVSEGDVLSVVDAGLKCDVDVDELTRACRIACWCIQDYEQHRPSMAQVVQVLDGMAEVYSPPVPQSMQLLMPS